MEQVTQGVAQMGIEPPQQQRKKKAARAHHNLTPVYQQQQQQQQQLDHHQALGNGFHQPAQPAYNNGIPTPPQQHQQQYSSLPAHTAENNTLSVPFMREFHSAEYTTTTPFRSFENTLPPPSTTKYQAIDQGNAIPKFQRLTLNCVPASEQIRNSTKLPLGLTVRPFAPLEENEEPVPEVDLLSMDGPPRCRRCRTYLNPQMIFTHEQKFICNMCKFPNHCPGDYVSPIDVSGKRMDYLQRPELHKGVVDFLVPDSYWIDDNKPPAPLHHVFLIDVSAEIDVIRASTDAIRSILNDLPQGVKIGIITYDKAVHFYNLNSDRPQITVASDLEPNDVFIPISDGLFVDPSESFSIHDTLNKIDEMYSLYRPNEVAYGAALSYALEALRLVGGGKITATLSKLPTWGPGLLINPNNKALTPEIYQAKNEHYQRLSDAFIKSNVGLSLFVFSSGSVDLINSANTVFKTSGELKLYSNYVNERDQRQFNEDFKSSVLSTTGYQGQLKVRCSNGLQVSTYYGNFEVNGSQDPKLPILSSNQEFSVLFSYDDKLNPKEDAHFQTALLYTGVDGRRRVRVINSIAAVKQEVDPIFSFADQDSVLNIIIKNCLHYISKQNPTEVKLSTRTKLVEILTQYRTLVNHSHLLPSQMVFPDSLSTLPAYINSFQKSDIFKPSAKNNSRIYEFYKLNSLPLDRLLYQLYPAFISLHGLTEDDAQFNEMNQFSMPRNAKAEAASLIPGGCLLVFNGENVYIWIHPDVNPNLVLDLFGVESIHEIDPLMIELPHLDTVISLQVRNIISYFQQYLRLDFLGFQIVRQGIDGSDLSFTTTLVEDKTMDKTESYNDFVVDIHREIRQRIDENKIVKEAEHDDSTLSQRFVHF